MSGPPKRPTKLRKLEGNPSKRPLPKNEPQPDPTKPTCPEWLLDDAKDEWARISGKLHEIGLLTQVDRIALAAYCQSYAKWKLAEEVIKNDGMVYPILDEDGNVKYYQQKPEVGIANQCLKQIRGFCAEFGLTPAARARIELPNEKDSGDDFASKLRSKIA